MARLFGAVLALALLSSQAGSLLHYALVAHVRCVHGELVHAGSERSVPAAEGTGSAGPVAAPANAEGHGHDHCMAPGLLPAAAALPARAAEPPVSVAVLNERRCAPRRPSAVPVYAFAPKTSPPVG